jgi:endonuclease III
MAVVTIVVADVELTIVVAVHVHRVAVRIKSLFCEDPSVSPHVFFKTY